MKHRKIVIPTLIAVVALAAGALYIPISRAATDMLIFGANTGGEDSLVTFIDFSGAPTTNQNYTLPSVSGKQGQIVIIKATNGEYGENGTFANVYPATGETLENDPEKEYYQVGSWGDTAAAIFIADPTNDTWWLVSNS